MLSRLGRLATKVPEAVVPARGAASAAVKRALEIDSATEKCVREHAEKQRAPILGSKGVVDTIEDFRIDHGITMDMLLNPSYRAFIEAKLAEKQERN